MKANREMAITATLCLATIAIAVRARRGPALGPLQRKCRYAGVPEIAKC
jgi:hypothetical protein